MAMWARDSTHALPECAKTNRHQRKLCLLLKQSGTASATPRAPAVRGAIHEVPVIVAAVHLLVPGAEPTGVVHRAERALMPSQMDMPETTTTTTGVAATVPSARGATHSRSALHEAPCLPAAAHTRGAIAEEACAMGCTKRSAPSIRDGRLQRSRILPTERGGPGRVGLVLVRLL